MNTFSTDLFGVGFPPEQKEVEEISAEIIFVDSVVVDHSTEALDGENSDIGIFVENEMGDFLHKGIRVVISGLLCAGDVHDRFGVEDVEFDNEVSHNF